MKKATALDTLPPTFAAAGVMSIAVYPVDVVRALCMSQPGVGASAALKGFLDAHGVMGFVKQGMVTEVFRSSVARGIKFWIQPQAHQFVFGKDVKFGNGLTQSAAGVMAVFPEVWAISPLENIKLAQQLDKEKKFKSAFDVARHLLRTRGVVGGLYCGYFGMQLRQCLWTGGFFLVLDSTKQAVKDTGLIPSALARDVIAGFLAGAFGTSLNCWTDVVRSVIQKRIIAESFDPKIPAPPALSHITPTMFFKETASIYGARGIKGLYSGVGPKMVHLGFGGAILAVLMPRFKDAWFELKGLE